MSCNSWSCLVTAFATALGRPFRELIDLIGHDGSEIVWTDLPEPQCRRGFSIDELIDVCDMLGYAVTPFCLYPEHRPTEESPAFNPLPYAVDRAHRIIAHSYGVITGTRARGVGHAVAYHYGKFDNSDFNPLIVWRIDAIQR